MWFPSACVKVYRALSARILNNSERIFRHSARIARLERQVENLEENEVSNLKNEIAYANRRLDEVQRTIRAARAQVLAVGISSQRALDESESSERPMDCD